MIGNVERRKYFVTIRVNTQPVAWIFSPDFYQRSFAPERLLIVVKGGTVIRPGAKLKRYRRLIERLYRKFSGARCNRDKYAVPVTFVHRAR